MKGHHHHRRRRAAVATAVGAVIFVLVSLAVFSAFAAMELHSTHSTMDRIVQQNILGDKNQELLKALFDQQDQTIIAGNNGSVTSRIIGLISVDAATGDLQLNQMNVVLPPGSSAAVCSSGCSSYRWVLTSLGNVFSVTSTKYYGFDITLSNSSSYTLRGGTNATTIVLRALGGYNDKVMLYVPNQPVGVNVTFIPQIFTPTSAGAEGAMVLNVSSTAIPNSYYQLDIEARGSDGATNSTTYLLAIE